MEIETTKDSRMSSIIVLFDMQTSFFPKAIEGIQDIDAQKRLDTKANHVAWLAGSLVEQRYELVNQFGIQAKQSAHDLFSNNKGIQDGMEYPSLESFKKDWDAITDSAREALLNADAATLEKPIVMPGMTMTFYDLITFMIYREANCIGQIALWRRLLGYTPMNYM
ncbi:MAG: DinB family protein [Cytophagales bacterium]|nr:DinB family protein [Cytophaga sp.]